MNQRQRKNFCAMNTPFLKKLDPYLRHLQPMTVRPTGAVANCRKDETIKAVIFDIYGTLLISASGDIMQDSYDASMFSRALASAGYFIKVPESALMAIHPLFERQVLDGKNKPVTLAHLSLSWIWLRFGVKHWPKPRKKV